MEETMPCKFLGSPWSVLVCTTHPQHLPRITWKPYDPNQDPCFGFTLYYYNPCKPEQRKACAPFIDEEMSIAIFAIEPPTSPAIKYEISREFINTIAVFDFPVKRAKE